MKGKLRLNPITRKHDIVFGDTIYTIADRFQKWMWLKDGDAIEFQLEIKSVIDDSKCKCKSMSYEDSVTCKHFVGGGINDCMQIESTMHKVAALQWPQMTECEMKNVDSFALAFMDFANRYESDNLSGEEILKEFKKLNGLTQPLLW